MCKKNPDEIAQEGDELSGRINELDGKHDQASDAERERIRQRILELLGESFGGFLCAVWFPGTGRRKRSTIKQVLVATVVIVALIVAIRAAHAEIMTTINGSIASGYIYDEWGAWASRQPVLQIGITRSTNHLTYGLWCSTELSGRSPYGHRGGGDQYTVSASYADNVSTPLGSMHYVVSGAYQAFGYKGSVKETFGLLIS